MRVKQQKSKLATNSCPTGDCPSGTESLKKIRLSPHEKRAIFFSLKREIFKHKQLKRNLPLV
jgi:hypothetical protein